MASISSPGIGSGLDINGILSQLMEIERRPLAQLDSKEAGLQARLSAYGALKGALASFQGAARALNDLSKFETRSARSADSGHLRGHRVQRCGGRQLRRRGQAAGARPRSSPRRRSPTPPTRSGPEPSPSSSAPPAPESSPPAPPSPPRPSPSTAARPRSPESAMPSTPPGSV
ncbi:MAG: hypothetical protein MZV65_52085 [Chromatiales bacterium]|nr:hypothetical protein [Chromatiales bacterium]